MSRTFEKRNKVVQGHPMEHHNRQLLIGQLKKCNTRDKIEGEGCSRVKDRDKNAPGKTWIREVQ